MTLLEMSIPGEPVGKARARVVLGGMQTFTPRTSARWESMTAMLARSRWTGDALDEPVAVHVRAVASRPQRLLRRRSPRGRIWRTTKPDGDNVLKAVCDALKKGGLVVDDTRFSRKTVDSLFVAIGEQPCVEIIVSRLAEYGTW